MPVSSDKSENTFSGETIDLDAKAYYIKAISLKPINTEDYLYRALSKQRLKDYAGAFELNPKNLIAYNNRVGLGGIIDEESKNNYCK